MNVCCGAPETKDLSQGIGTKRHMYCSKCKSHYFNDRMWTAKEWEAWVNGGDEVSDLLANKEIPCVLASVKTGT